LGDLSAFSFYPTKNLGGYGDGGMIVTKNKKLYEKCKKLRKYGMSKFILFRYSWNKLKAR
jgi:UDP-2-acetamido-2-deoxy-ribo-hexuluronate aminotransferase